MMAHGRLWLLVVVGGVCSMAAGCDTTTTTTRYVESELPDLFVERTSDVLAFENPRECARCHSEHVADWEISNHAYAIKDPVFHAMIRMGQAQTEGKLGQFCVQCHTPTGMAMGQTPVVLDADEDLFRQVFDDLDAVAQQGVSCDVCHSVTDVIEPVNATGVWPMAIPVGVWHWTQNCP
ncbi:MAG: ammonia-forming cytochrome c nitrite reductase subunit c552, partial [Myxococcota bacterium]